MKNNNQICWLLTKVQLADGSNQGFKTFQQFLDAKQYSRNGILRYEKIFGHNYVSTGGEDTTKVWKIDSLKPEQNGRTNDLIVADLNRRIKADTIIL